MCFCIMCLLCHTIEFNTCKRDHMAYRVLNIYRLVLYRKGIDTKLCKWTGRHINQQIVMQLSEISMDKSNSIKPESKMRIVLLGNWQGEFRFFVTAKSLT